MSARTKPRRVRCSHDASRLICWLGSIVGWICALLFNSRALASDANAINCIGVTGQQGHTDSGFWSEFKNHCGYGVDASFDVLLFQCEQDDYSACGNDNLLKVHTSVQHTFGGYESFTVSSAIPNVRCFSYQWDINLETPGCNLPEECWCQAMTVESASQFIPYCSLSVPHATYPASSGEQFHQASNCLQCGACCPGDTSSCSSGCGYMACDASGNWDVSACTYPNECGSCGPVGECCPGASANCEGGCGVMFCDASGSWDASGCSKKNSCGQCGNDTGECCQGVGPICEPSTLKPLCSEGSWKCPQANEGRTAGAGGAGETGAASAGASSATGGGGAGGAGAAIAGKGGHGGMAGSKGKTSTSSSGSAGAGGHHYYGNADSTEQEDGGIGCAFVSGTRRQPALGAGLVIAALGLASSRMRRKK